MAFSKHASMNFKQAHHERQELYSAERAGTSLPRDHSRANDSQQFYRTPQTCVTGCAVFHGTSDATTTSPPTSILSVNDQSDASRCLDPHRSLVSRNSVPATSSPPVTPPSSPKTLRPLTPSHKSYQTQTLSRMEPDMKIKSVFRARSERRFNRAKPVLRNDESGGDCRKVVREGVEETETGPVAMAATGTLTLPDLLDVKICQAPENQHGVVSRRLTQNKLSATARLFLNANRFSPHLPSGKQVNQLTAVEDPLARVRESEDVIPPPASRTLDSDKIAVDDVGPVSSHSRENGDLNRINQSQNNAIPAAEQKAFRVGMVGHWDHLGECAVTDSWCEPKLQENAKNLCGDELRRNTTMKSPRIHRKRQMSLGEVTPGSRSNTVVGRLRHWGLMTETYEGHFVLVVLIVLNGLVVGISTYFDYAGQTTAYIVFFGAKVLFSCVFVVDLFFRCMAYGLRSFLASWIHVLDLALVLVGVVEAAVTAVTLSRGNYYENSAVTSWLAAVQMLRVIRLYRLIYLVNDFFMFAQGIIHSARALIWTALFLFIVIYACAVFCTSVWGLYPVNEAMQNYYGSLHDALYTMFVLLTVEGWTDIADATAEIYPWSRIFFVIFICFAGLMMMNVVTGVVCDAFVCVYGKFREEINYKQELESLDRISSKMADAFCRNSLLVSDAFTGKPGSPSGGNAFVSAGRHFNSGARAVEKKSGSMDSSTSPLSTLISECRRRSSTTLVHQVENARPIGTATLPTSAGSQLSRKCRLSDSDASVVDDGESTGKSSFENRFKTRGNTKWLSQASKHLWRIDLRNTTPVDILLSAGVDEALQECEIPTVIAFDVLNIYCEFGVKSISVGEFTSSCRRLCVPMTSKHLLNVDIRTERQLHDLYTTVVEMREQLDSLQTLFQSAFRQQSNQRR
eukprot:GHVQ01023125.1.p1 GENE.GHVQ01023125.1~~GHVQ01023125.1.p1  ORF type:complete len:910 (-),score=62.31 GHVQ01023125.1:427-3156(-)